MAWAFGTRLGEQAAGTSTCTIACTLAVGDFVVLWVACDNTAGTNLPNVSGVSYNGVAQTFTVVASHNSTSTTAAAAVRGFIVVVPSNTTAGTAASLTVSFSAAPAKSVMIAATFTGGTSTVSGTAGQGTSTVGTPTASLGSQPPAGDLILGLASCENNVAMSVNLDAVGGGTDTAPGGDGVVFSTGGGAAANVAMACDYKITVNDGGGSVCSVGSGAGANDSGACIVALAVAAATTPSLVIPPRRHVGLNLRPRKPRTA